MTPERPSSPSPPGRAAKYRQLLLLLPLPLPPLLPLPVPAVRR
jgi:hypothetical protein